MAFLSDEERNRVASAIIGAERGTSGEIATVVSRSSDSYLFIPLLWASVLALLVPVPFLFLLPELPATWVYLIQLAFFIAAALLFRWSPVTMQLIPLAVKRQRAGRLAREQFLEQGLHDTRDRNGILIFVSVAERYVEILADRGIDERVEEGTWDRVVADFAGEMKAGRVVEGFVAAVGACGVVLAEHYPKTPDDRDELPNRLIEI